MSYSHLLILLQSQPEQMAMNILKDGGSTSCVISTPEGKMTISINNSLGDRKHNGDITVQYPDGEVQTISPDNMVVNPQIDNDEESRFDSLIMKPNDIDILK